MTLRHIRIFLTVYKIQNITKAAQALCMTQPAVTRAIKEIEAYYGIQLFDRINKKLYVTERGEVFYSYAVHIMDTFNQMESSLLNWQQTGTVNIGTTITIGNLILPKVLCEFKKSFPNIKVKANIATGYNLKKMLSENKIDFAVMEGTVNSKEFALKKLADDKLVLIMPPDDKRANKDNISLNSLKDDTFILRDKESVGRNFVDNAFSLHGMSVSPDIESVSTQAIVRAVHNGLGISFLPYHLMKKYIESGYVSTAEITDESFERENYIVWQKQKFLSNSAKSLMECFLKFNYDNY